jgi:hypothetical protein
MTQTMSTKGQPIKTNENTNGKTMQTNEHQWEPMHNQWAPLDNQ